ncbi:MAG: hypothetical protein ACRDJ4_15355 [Actinomycetota bacterium]
MRATTSANYLSTLQLTRVEVDSIDSAYRLLDRPKVEAVVYDSPVLLYHASSNGQGKVRVVGPVFNRQDYGIAVPTGPLRERISRTLLQMLEDGSYRRIQERWFGPSE